MLKNERQKKIVEIINQEKVVAITDLSEQLEVSHMTLWRDLDELAQDGLVERIRGGAMACQQDIFDLRGNFDSAQKTAIGKYAAQNLVDDGDFITIEAGTTTSSIVPHISAANLTILTNGLLTSFFAHQSKADLNLICSGGVLIETGAFTGPQAEDFFSSYRVSKAFLGATGLTIEDGFTDPTPLYLRIKKSMIANADQIILMLTSNKIGVRSLLQVAAFEKVDMLVTDAGVSKETVTALEDRDIEVHIAA